MKEYEKRIADYKDLIQKQYVRESAVRGAAVRCRSILAVQGGDSLSYFEFLYEQSRFIKKRWWGLQGGILFLLWFILKDFGGMGDMERVTGVLAASFAVLVIPEIWKNRRFSAMEVECASYYTLRQICGARILLFAIADLSMITVFLLAVFRTMEVSAYEVAINFLVPFNVSGCICFRTFCSGKFEMEYAAVLVSAVWTGIWLAVVTCDSIYNIIAGPVWLALAVLSFVYLVYCIYRSQVCCDRIWEENDYGIKA